MIPPLVFLKFEGVLLVHCFVFVFYGDGLYFGEPDYRFGLGRSVTIEDLERDVVEIDLDHLPMVAPPMISLQILYPLVQDALDPSITNIQLRRLVPRLVSHVATLGVRRFRDWRF